MAPALEIVDLTDDAEISPLKVSGAGNRIQPQPKVKAEVGESSTHAPNPTQGFRVLLQNTVNGPRTPDLALLTQNDIDFLTLALAQLEDRDIASLARHLGERKPGPKHENWKYICRKTYQIWMARGYSGLASMTTPAKVEASCAARDMSRSGAAPVAPAALPVPTDTEMNNVIYCTTSATLRSALAELCKQSPALKRALVRKLQPNGRFAQSNIAVMKSEQAAKQPAQIDPNSSAQDGARVKSEAGPSSQIPAAALAGGRKKYPWMNTPHSDMAAASRSNATSPEYPQRPSNPTRPTDLDLLLASTRRSSILKPVLPPSADAPSIVQMSTPRSTVSPNSADLLRQRQVTPYNADHDRDWEHNRNSLKRKSPSDDEEEESEEEEVEWWVEERKKNDAWKADLCFFCDKRLGDHFFNSKDNHDNSCLVHSGILKADGKHEDWLGRSRPTWHRWKANRYTLDRYVWDCCGAKGDASGCQTGKHVNQQVAEKRLRKSNSIARERKKRRTL